MKPLPRFLAFLLASLWLFSMGASAQVYCSASAGNDRNDGRTDAKLRALTPGEAVLIALQPDGTEVYRGVVVE